MAGDDEEDELELLEEEEVEGAGVLVDEEEVEEAEEAAELSCLAPAL